MEPVRCAEGKATALCAMEVEDVGNVKGYRKQRSRVWNACANHAAAMGFVVHVRGVEKPGVVRVVEQGRAMDTSQSIALNAKDREELSGGYLEERDLARRAEDWGAFRGLRTNVLRVAEPQF